MSVWALAAWLAAASGWPGPSRGERADSPAQNAACEGCHVEVAREWRGSQHQRAYVDADFAESLAREPSAFCRGCHAAEADPTRAAPAELAALGVACVTCHKPGDTVLAGPVRAGMADAAPHALRRSPGFAEAAACGRCHAFSFPGRPALAMQDTLREHTSSAYASTSCIDCHMPRRADGGRDHRFAASRDPALLKRALRVRAARRSTAVHLSLEPGWVGHAMPTGDLFRRLRVEAEVADLQWQVLASDSQVLGRRFASGGHRVPVADDRVGAAGPTPTEVVLELGEAAVGRTIRWRVQYERVAFASGDGATAKVWDSVTIADGSLPALRSPGKQ
jgi:hypothetical protein